MKQPIKILFICHGNICRSVMAEYIMKDKVKKRALESHFFISSKATSTEEIGNDIYSEAKKILNLYNISYTRHYAQQVKRADYDAYDYLLVMDEMNLYNLKRIVGQDEKHKIYKLLAFAENHHGDISDPWYSGRFNQTYEELDDACEGLIAYLLENH